MRSHEGTPRPCIYCKTPTLFVREVIGLRGVHVGWEDCCPLCGEQPTRREALAKAAA